MTRFGVLLPHFGRYATLQLLIDGAQMAEELGFSSIWARDHLVYEPHGFEDHDRTFLETFVTLASVGTHTRTLVVGTAATIPTRHPLQLAHICSSVTRLLGPDRLILGLGSGGFEHEFRAVGLGGIKRPELVLEQAGILRDAWSAKPVSHAGTHYAFDSVSVHPAPMGSIPLLYAGATPRAARLAGRHFDGWLPGRLNLPTFARRVQTVRELAEARGRSPITGLVPVTSIDRDRTSALAKVPVDRLLENANGQRFWERPEGGTFTTPDDLVGSLIFGDADLVVEQLSQLINLNIDHLVFDLRLRFDEWTNQIQVLGTDVLPRLIAS